MSFEDSVKAEKEKIEQEAQAYLEKADLPGFWAMPVDDTSTFRVLDEEIRDKDFGQGLRKIFAVEVNGERKDWALNPKNPLYSEIIVKLAEGDRVFKVNRSGEKAKTRYTLKESLKPVTKETSQ